MNVSLGGFWLPTAVRAEMAAVPAYVPVESPSSEYGLISDQNNLS